MTSPKAPMSWNIGNIKQLPHHAAFGGWISHVMDKVEDKHRQKDIYGVNQKGFRKLLGRPSNPRRFKVVTKRPVMVGKPIMEDYENVSSFFSKS